MDEPESTSNEESMDAETVELITKLNELYREAQLSQTEDISAAKSNECAKKYMEEGRGHFLNKKFEDAMNSYTTCVACAEEDSEVIGEAYANRSAVLLILGYFEQCIQDVDRALSSNYPEDKKKSLHVRKERASKMAESQSPALASSRTREVEAEWRDKLCNFHNPHIPGASNKIQLESNEEWGRHLIATENINAGEILTCQKFFTMVKTNDVSTNHACSYCLLFHPALIPCPRCVLVMYCSEHCRSEAFNSYHRIECRVLQTEVAREKKMNSCDYAALKCLLIGTDQGAGLASLMKKIKLQNIVDLEANIDKFIEKPFPSDYMFLLRLCRKFHIPLADEIDVIPKIIIALQKAGYFDSISDPIQREAHIDEKDGNINESVCEKDANICSKVLDSVEVADESVDKKEESDVCKNEGRPIIQEHEDPSTIVGKEFVKKVTYHYCELCNICLYYNPEISQDEIVLSHCRTPLHVERCSARNSEEQEVTTQECVAETSPSKNVLLDTMAMKPQLDSASKRKKRRSRKAKARLESASSARSDDANEQKKFQDEAPLNAKYGNNNESVDESGDISSEVLESIEVVDEPVNEKEDPDVGKNEDRPIVQEHEDSSRIFDGLKRAMLPATVILESNSEKEDPDGSENEDRSQEHDDSPKIAGKEFIKEVSGYYCEVCNLCLRYKPEMSEDEALMAHCSTPLHLKRSLLKTSEEIKDGNTKECVTETLLSKTAAEPPSDSTSQPPGSSTEISTALPDSLSARNDTNQQKGQKHQDVSIQECLTGTSQFKNVTLGKMAKEPRSDSPPQPKSTTEPIAPPLDSLPASSDANEQNLVERQTYLLTKMELYACFLLLNHKLSIDSAFFTLRKLITGQFKGILYGFGVCNLHAMINHSCDPNVDFVRRRQEMALFALRPISKGEQISISYTVTTFAFNSLQLRQEMKINLPTSKFQFNCECVACVNKWPIFGELVKLRPKFLFSNKKAAIEAIHKITSPLLTKPIDSMSRLEILRVVGELREWLHINVENPSAASTLCEELLTRVMYHFYDTASAIELTELDKILEGYLSEIIKFIK